MTETEAKSFIEQEVSATLWKRVALAASIIGLTNLIAVLALWMQLIAVAKETASRESERAAQDEVKKKSEVFQAQVNTILKQAEERTRRMDDSFFKAAERMGEVSEAIKQIENQNRRLTLLHQDLEKRDPERLKRIADILDSISDQDRQSLLERLGQLQTSFVKAYDAFPKGTILAYYGSLESLDREKWGVCDGVSGPDLKGYFLRGASHSTDLNEKYVYRKYTPEILVITEKVRRSESLDERETANVVRHVRGAPEDVFPPHVFVHFIIRR